MRSHAAASERPIDDDRQISTGTSISDIFLMFFGLKTGFPTREGGTPELALASGALAALWSGTLADNRR